MNLFLEFGFLFFLLLPLHSYLFYPIIIRIISLSCRKNNALNEQDFSISILISAYNEEKVIEDRIKNIESLDYDFNKIEVLVGSDCSSDKTNEILSDLKKNLPWLKIFLFGARRGKVSVINDLVRKAANDILVFTDANTVFEKNSLKRLVSAFHNPEVGGVSGRLILTESKKGLLNNLEEKSYWEYETFLKKYEGRCGVLIGANGGIFVIRRELFTDIPSQKSVTDDLYISLMVLSRNYKFSYEEDAVAYEEAPAEFIIEFKRKVRFATTNFYTLVYFKNLLFNKNTLLSFAFWSHKVLRWITPIILILILILTILLLDEREFYKIFLYVQIFFYLVSLIGFLINIFNIKLRIFTFPFYFVMTNIALFIGLVRFCMNKQTPFWQSTPR